MNNIKWDDLRTFLAIARHGTLAAAATVLSVNASTVQRRITALEDDLEARLFERGTRGYALTHVGEALVARAEAVEEAVMSLRRTVSGHDRSAQGAVVLTMPATLIDFVTPVVSDVRANCPGLRPVIRAEDRVLDLRADVDLALRPSPDPPLDAVGRAVGKIAWAVYSTSDSDVLPWVAYAPGGGPLAASAWRRRNHGSEPVACEVSTVGAMHSTLRCVQARGLLPCYLGDRDPTLKRSGPLVTEATTTLWLLFHADLRRSARVRALVDLLLPRIKVHEQLFSGELG